MKESQRKGYCSRHLSIRSKSTTAPDAPSHISPRTHRVASAAGRLGQEPHISPNQGLNRRSVDACTSTQMPSPVAPRRGNFPVQDPARKLPVTREDERAVAQMLVSLGWCGLYFSTLQDTPA